MKYEGFFQGDKQMASFTKWIGASTIAAAALMLLTAPVAAAEQMVPVTVAPEFHLAQAGTGNPCAMGGGMMGGGAANPCGGKSCGMMGANKKSHDYKKDPYKDYKPGTVTTRLDKKLARLKTAIELRKDQETAFKAFTDTIRDRVKPTEEILITLSNRWKRKDAPGALERLALREKKAAIHHANISVTRQALERLYKVLGEDQKKRVDTLFAKRRFHHLP
jgi:hypothetical protein